MKPLSKMQWLVWVCWSSGMTQKQTAYSLNLSPWTVDTYRKRIRQKTGIANPELKEELPHAD